jgi:uncharacterized RDD family membrane protein YckC/type II secretory pathway pseudopilin PulG
MDNEPPPPANPAPAPAAPEAQAPDVSAGFWLRAGAYMIDGIIVAIVSVGLNLILPETLSIIVRLLLSAGYFTLMPVLNQGQTLGKMAGGIAIIREDGSPIGYGRALARWLGYLVSGLTLCLGFICAAFTKHKRGLHDYIADTRVVRVEEIGPGRKIAVILVGLLFPLLVVLGIVAALAIPRFANLKGMADEGSAKGRLGMLRSATAIYYGDTEGNYPTDLNALVPKYMPELSAAGVSTHPGAAGVEIYGAEVCSGSKEPGQDLVAGKLRDTGKWGYVIAPKSPCDGTVFIDCTHNDSKGRAWYSY